MGENVGAHPDEPFGAPLSEIQPPEELLPARLGGGMEGGGRRRIGVRTICADRALEPLGVGAEVGRERPQELDLTRRGQRGVTFDQLPGEDGTEGLSPPRDERLGQGRKAAGGGAPPPGEETDYVPDETERASGVGVTRRKGTSRAGGRPLSRSIRSNRPASGP